MIPTGAPIEVALGGLPCSIFDKTGTLKLSFACRPLAIEDYLRFRELLKVVLEPAMNPVHARALCCVIRCKGDFATIECGADVRGLSLTPRADDDDKLSTSLSSFILRKADFTGPM